MKELTGEQNNKLLEIIEKETKLYESRMFKLIRDFIEELNEE